MNSKLTITMRVVLVWNQLQNTSTLKHELWQLDDEKRYIYTINVIDYHGAQPKLKLNITKKNECGFIEFKGIHLRGSVSVFVRMINDHGSFRTKITFINAKVHLIFRQTFIRLRHVMKCFYKIQHNLVIQT